MMLDADLAVLYGVETEVLVKAVKRNVEHFPADLMFQILPGEIAPLRFQIGTSKRGRGGHRSAPSSKRERAPEGGTGTAHHRNAKIQELGRDASAYGAACYSSAMARSAAVAAVAVVTCVRKGRSRVSRVSLGSW